MYKSSARISLHLLPGFEFLKIKSVLYDTDNTPKNVTDLIQPSSYRHQIASIKLVSPEVSLNKTVILAQNFIKTIFFCQNI